MEKVQRAIVKLAKEQKYNRHKLNGQLNNGIKVQKAKVKWAKVQREIKWAKLCQAKVQR